MNNNVATVYIPPKETQVSPSPLKAIKPDLKMNTYIPEFLKKLCEQQQNGRNFSAKLGISAVVLTAGSVTIAAFTLANPFLIVGIIVAGLLVIGLAFIKYQAHKDNLSVCTFIRDSYTPDPELMKTRVENFLAHSDESTKKHFKKIANEIQNGINNAMTLGIFNYLTSNAEQLN